MERNIRVVISASSASLLALSALAENSPTTPNPKKDRPNFSKESPSNARRPDQLNGATQARHIVGMTVENSQDEKLGQLEEIASQVLTD